MRVGMRGVTVVLVTALAGCGGGGGSDSGATTTPEPPVLSIEEAAAVKDSSTVYAVTDVTPVIEASVTTTNGVWTLADVDADVDDSDNVTPEVDAHLATSDYPDDGKAVNATLRLRGHSSRLADQKSYRIKLSGSSPLWRGETTIQLNKHPYDLTRVRNKLAFDLFRVIPHIPSLRTQFVHMTLNGQDYGLFTHVEKMGKEYLANRGLPTDGNIYKAEDFAFRHDDNLALDAAGKPLNKANFEKTLSLEADNKDHRLLLRMLADLNDPAKPFAETFARYFDRDNYLTWLSTSILMGNRDTVNQNFALYQPKGTEKFYFLPWDYDGSLGFENQPDIRAAGNLYDGWQLGLGNWWGVSLHRQYLQDPSRVKALQRAVDEIYTSYLTTEKLQPLLDRYRPLVRPWVAAAPDRDYLPLATGNTMAEWDGEYARLAHVIRDNRERFLADLQKPMPFFQAAELLDGGATLRLGWDPSFDLQGGLLSYRVRVSASPDFATTLVDRNMTATELLLPALPKGDYFLKVVVSDPAGNTQGAFDRFESGGKTWFGVLPFSVP